MYDAHVPVGPIDGEEEQELSSSDRVYWDKLMQNNMQNERSFFIEKLQIKKVYIV